MQLATAFNNAWTKVIRWVYKKLDERLWKERLSKALEGLSKEDLAFYESLLINQMRYQQLNAVYNLKRLMQSRAEQSRFDDMQFKTARRMLDHLKELRLVVGVQPMNHPVGFAYNMAYAPVDQDVTRTDGSTHRQLNIFKSTVQASTKHLRAHWSVELYHDLVAMHGVDLVQELSQALALEVAYEIAEFVFSDLKELAIKGGKLQTIDLAAFDDDSSPEGVFQRNASFAFKLNTLVNQIEAATSRAPANFIIGGASSVSLLQTLGSAFVPAPTGTPTGALLTYAGTVSGKIKVYYSPIMVDDSDLILGYKGDGEVDTGYIYCPYVPLGMSSPQIDTATFQSTVSMMTRYGTKTLTQNEINPVDSNAYYALLSFIEPESVTDTSND